MKISIRERNVRVSRLLRNHVERRLGFALGPFAEQIGRVLVRFSHQGGTDKRCQIDVVLRPHSLMVEDTDSDLFAAASHAIDRGGRCVARMLERGPGLEARSRWTFPAKTIR